MRMEVHVHGSLPLVKGVTRGQIEAALQPWLEYLDVDALEEAKSLEPEEPGINLDEQSRTLEICWTGDVGRSFQRCLEDALQALGPYTEHAAEVEVSLYYETGEDEVRLIFVGPSADAIHEAQRLRMVEDVSYLLARHFGKQEVDEVVAHIDELFRRDRERAGSRDRTLELASMPLAGTPGRKHLH